MVHIRGIYNDAIHTPTGNIADAFAEAMQNYKDDLVKKYNKTYLEIAQYARVNALHESKITYATKDFVNSDVQHYFLEHAGARIDGINETTLKELQNQLYVAYTMKEKPSQWEARIRQVLDCEKPKRRAEMIARTELAWAYAKGTLATYQEIGVQRVQWMAVMDARTCPTCSERNGEIYTLHEIEDMLPAHPRCRCTAVSVDE